MELTRIIRFTVSHKSHVSPGEVSELFLPQVTITVLINSFESYGSLVHLCQPDEGEDSGVMKLGENLIQVIVK